MIKTPELLADAEIMESLKRIEAMAARDGYDMTKVYQAIDAAYRAGCAVARAREAADAIKPGNPVG